MVSAVSFVVALPALALFWVGFLTPRLSLPAHLTGHPIIDRTNFLDTSTIDDLMQMTRDFGVIPSVLRDADSYAVKNNHIGEKVPFNRTIGTCPETFLIPDPKREHCIFPGRVDVGRHFIQHGGIEGLKERFDVLAARAQPFIRYIFNYTSVPVVKRLLESPDFQSFAASVCPAGKPQLDPFQFNVIIQVPGQSTATHIDAPVFYHMNRFEFPQWLLVAAVFSGLFKEEFVDQVQVVAYFHKWQHTPERAGEFVFWTNTDNTHGQLSIPHSGSANVVDGSKTVHAAAVYAPHRLPPLLPKEGTNELRFDKATGLWHVASDGSIQETYTEDALRFAAVYRARCFADQADRARFVEAQQNQWSMAKVLGVFRADLHKRGVLDEKAVVSPYDLGVLILDTYIKYPLPEDAWIPFNYCVADRAVPWLEPLVRLLC